jgi:hypothetical protein
VASVGATDATIVVDGTAGNPSLRVGDLSNTYVKYRQLAKAPDTLITGAVTRDSNGAATSAPVVWPDGSPGTYTADTVSTAFPGAVDGYHITYGSPVTKTYTQPAVTRDAATGAATSVPAIVVT